MNVSLDNFNSLLLNSLPSTNMSAVLQWLCSGVISRAAVHIGDRPARRIRNKRSSFLLFFFSSQSSLSVRLKAGAPLVLRPVIVIVFCRRPREAALVTPGCVPVSWWEARGTYHSKCVSSSAALPREAPTSTPLGPRQKSTGRTKWLIA